MASGGSVFTNFHYHNSDFVSIHGTLNEHIHEL
jgi:hypothetical protein